MPRRIFKKTRRDVTGTENRLLALLPAADLAALQPDLEFYPLKTRDVLIRPMEPVEYVYFVCDGMVSLVQLMESGKFTETGIVGREGMVGALAPLGASAFSHEAVVQIEGVALRMKAEALRAHVARLPALRDLLLRYIQAIFSQVAQSAVCNNQHTVRERLSRWLAMGADCVESDTLRLTHELLSIMLGVRRSSVTDSLAALKADALITTYQGGIKVVDRGRLQSNACECYDVVKNEFRRLLGPSIFQTGGSSPSRNAPARSKRRKRVK